MNERSFSESVIIKLTNQEAQQMVIICMDEDAEEALNFLRNKLTKYVEKSILSS